MKGINLHVNAGETVAIVGESGSGKSQTMMAAMGLLASNGEATGSVDYRGTEPARRSPRPSSTSIRGRKITMIFQEPMTSLDPLYSIGSQIDRADPPASRAERRRGARREAIELLELVQHSRSRAAHRSPIRTNCRAASASA